MRAGILAHAPDLPNDLQVKFLIFQELFITN